MLSVNAHIFYNAVSKKSGIMRLNGIILRVSHRSAKHNIQAPQGSFKLCSQLPLSAVVVFAR